jgi:uncharacterized protein
MTRPQSRLDARLPAYGPGVRKTGNENKRYIQLGILVSAFLTIALAACQGRPQVSISDAQGSTKAIVQVEIAETVEARAVGLMYRQKLAQDAGMLFVFKLPQHLAFWMKNTEIPLDMIFAAADGRVAGIVANAEPFSERPLSVAGDSKYVLEVNGGFARRHGIKPGDRMLFVDLTPVAKD